MLLYEFLSLSRAAVKIIKLHNLKGAKVRKIFSPLLSMAREVVKVFSIFLLNA
jgi:hypothetical protein